ncbi:MAG: hypothetical protein M5U01_41310 [Ardenticatenaceae bacterium]|nr:hypothetical protein [Ardenticatenaceae bacterium]
MNVSQSFVEAAAFRAVIVRFDGSELARQSLPVTLIIARAEQYLSHPRRWALNGTTRPRDLS